MRRRQLRGRFRFATSQRRVSAPEVVWPGVRYHVRVVTFVGLQDMRFVAADDQRTAWASTSAWASALALASRANASIPRIPRALSAQSAPTMCSPVRVAQESVHDDEGPACQRIGGERIAPCLGCALRALELDGQPGSCRCGALSSGGHTEPLSTSRRTMRSPRASAMGTALCSSTTPTTCQCVRCAKLSGPTS